MRKYLLMESSIKKVRNLFFSLFLFVSYGAYSFELEEYTYDYSSGKNTAQETLKKIDNETWKMSSKIEHSIFQVTQEATFKIVDNMVILLNAYRKTRAFGGFRREKQFFEVNYEKNEIYFEYNKKKGFIPFDCETMIDCRFFDNLTLQIQSKLALFKSELPLSIDFNYLDKGLIKNKTFKMESMTDLDKEDDVNKVRFSEVRDDDKGFMLWFDPTRNFQTYKIYQDFGSQDLTWNIVPKPLGE